MMAEICV